MSFSLTSNFFSNARGITFADGGGITWSFNKNTNAVTGAAAGGAAGANPTAKVGLAVVNGSATTFMRSDAAPPIDQTLAPTWTGNHTFTPGSGIGIVVNGNAGYAQQWLLSGGAGVGVFLAAGAGQIGTTNNQPLQFFVNGGSAALSIATGGAVTVTSTFAINNGTPTAKPTGYGTPSGTVTASLTSSATLAQTAGTLAALLAYLKTIGFIGA